MGQADQSGVQVGKIAYDYEEDDGGIQKGLLNLF